MGGGLGILGSDLCEEKDTECLLVPAVSLFSFLCTHAQQMISPGERVGVCVCMWGVFVLKL